MKKNPYLLILGFSIAWTITQAGFRAVYNAYQNEVTQLTLEPGWEPVPVEPRLPDELTLMYPAGAEAKPVPARKESGQKVKLPHHFVVSYIVEARNKEVLVQQAFGTNAGTRYWVEKRFLFRNPALSGRFVPVYREDSSSSATGHQAQR